MPLPGKIPFAAVASLLFLFSALGFAPAQCAIKPIKPIPPVGCKDLTPQCVTNSNGQSYWTWICVPNSTDAEQRELAARQAEADQQLYDSLGRGIASMKARHWVKKYCQKHPGDSWWYKNQRAGIDAHGVCPSAIPADSVSFNTSHVATELITPPVDDAARSVSYERGCNGGDMQFCANLGTMYRMGWGVSKDASKALALFQKACAGGNMDGCENAKNYQAQEPKEQAQIGPAHITQAQAAAPFQATNPASAQTRGINSTLMEKAQSGDANAEFQVGQDYANGEGVAQDFSNAALWYRKAAEQGDVNAQKELALLYGEGKGVPQDYAQVATWFRKAANQGDAAAEDALGLMYDYGEGVPQDYAQAAIWYRKAAEQGNADAEFNLAGLYLRGQGVSQDLAECARWTQKAAEQGNSKAQEALGMEYAVGRGVSVDMVEAYFWLDIAAASNAGSDNEEQWEKSRDDIASHLAPADLSRTQERARKWFEDHPAKPQ